MKTISRIIAVFAVCSMTVLAQGRPPEVGFVRIVNAVSPGEGKAKFFIDDRNLYPDGYGMGQTTGGYGVKAGNIEIEVRKEGVESGSTRLRLGIGETITVIAFAELQPPKKADDPPKWAIKLLRLKQQEVERGYGVSMVSVCRSEEVAVDLIVEGRERPERMFAKRLQITKVEIGRRRSDMIVRLGDRTLTTISPDSPGNYVVILYENNEGQTEAISYYDPKFVIAG